MSQWSHYHHITAFSEFLAYKTRVPVRGAIMLNEEMDEVVLVKGWKKGANWSFPRGKINKDEKDLDCAIREVYEETGFDVGEAGLVKDEKDVKFIEITMREQHMRLYVFRGVPRDAHFEPRTRKEISKIEWYKLSELPTLKKSKQHDQGFAVANANKFYMVAPFMHPLKKWIAHQKKIDAKNQVGHRAAELMDEAAQIASTITPVQVPVEMATPSDLPEAVPSGNASAHLKRLLNINNVPNQSSVQPSQEPTADPKSNALLQLLRGGSSEEPAMQTPMNEKTVPLEALSQRFPLPDVFPDHPRQTQYAEQSASLPQNLPPLFPGMVPPHIQHAVNVSAANQPMPQRPLDHQFLTTTHMGHSTGFQGFSPFSAPQPPVPSYREEALHTIPPLQKPAAAPYQKTGDPQFSHSGQPPRVKGSSVPPASKLPPPKLTSHSLALLNVFKNEIPKTPQTSSATMTPGARQDSVQAHKPSQHQDQLLNLLRGSPAPATSAPVPVELAADSTPPARKQTLQRPNQRSPNAGKGFNSKGQTSATVSGPLNMPQFEGIAKPAARRMQNGTNRKAYKDRQPQTQPLSSPITILARPQSAKRDQSSTPPPGSRTPSQSRTSKTKQAEPQRPFQPQILRRSEKTGSEIGIPLRPKAAPEPDQREQGMESPVHVDRRPSQTAAQREALLSLFGKKSDASGSPSPGPVNIQTSTAKPSGSSVISPLSPSIAPNIEAPVSGRGSPAENGLETPAAFHVSSPDNKAFLLGFLEGVAKGNK